MSIYELGLSYRQTAAMLRTRIVELERRSKAAADPVEQQQFMNRARPLRSMYRDVRTTARILEHYYDKHTPRRGRSGISV